MFLQVKKPLRLLNNQGDNTHWMLDVSKYVIIILLSCFDFYVSGIRVFDFVSYGYIVFFVVIYIKFNGFRISTVVTLLICVVYALIGLLSDAKLLSAFAILVNCILFFVFSSNKFLVEERHVRFALVFHMSFFVFQFAFYYTFNELINFHQFTDINPRLESSIFRPAGLFYEPAIYCLNVFMLLMLLPIPRTKLHLLEAFAVFTLLLSVSLLGFVYAGMILVRYICNKKYALIGYGLVLAILISLFVDQVFFDFVFNRVIDLKDDGSAQGRYQGLALIFSEPNIFYNIFGKGFGADFEKFGSSGISALISYIGIFLACFLTFIFLFIKENRFSKLFVIIGISISAPVFSYAIFPFWMANILKINKYIYHFVYSNIISELTY